MNDRPPTIRLKLDLPCTEREALLFTALVIYLYQINRDPGALPDPDLDESLGNNARAVIAEITSSLSDFGVESTYDRAASTLHIRDIDGKPNAAALSQALLSLFPTRLPIAFSVSSAVDPDKPAWAISGPAPFENGDTKLWWPFNSNLSDAAPALFAGRAAWKPAYKAWIVPARNADAVLGELSKL